MRNIFDTVLRDISFDSRITNGIFDIEKNDHMDILREYFTNKGIDSETVREYTNGVLEGKYPERQAYNVKGILVTFPTPEYKANAIKRGTHFEDDPTKRAPNVFAAAQQDKAAARTPAAEKPESPAPKAAPTSLPTSAAGPAPAPTDTKTPGQSPGKTPEQSPEAPPATTQAPQPPPEAAEPEPEPTELPEVPPKSPAEKTADKNVIKTMLKGDDYMLEDITPPESPYSTTAETIAWQKGYKEGYKSGYEDGIDEASRHDWINESSRHE
jgi:hypothetical protein